MAQLDGLIKELCPNGVEYKKLSDVLTIRNGKDYKGFAEGSIPVYGSGGIMTYIDHFAYDKPSVLIPRKGSLDKLYYVDVPFWTVDTIFYTVIDTKIVEPKYIFYVLQKEHLEKLNNAGGVPSLTQAVISKVKIPVPPMPVQREIVRILDNFTELTEEITEKLTAELTARKKQYEYYRDTLLTFGVHRGGTFETKWRTLAEIADIGTGSSNTNEAVEDGKYPFFVRSQEPLRKNDYEYDETAIITAGDGVGVGKVYHYVEGKYALHQRAYRIHIVAPDVLPRFFFYYMKAKFLPYIQKNVFQGSVSSIRRPMLNAFPVPVPDVELQERIVNVLDNFDAICSDLNIGLPAEIEARKKQYEYYRDMLLTFAAADDIILTDRQTDRQSLIKLLQYVFGYVIVPVSDICNIARGKVISKDTIRDNEGIYPVYSSQTENGGVLGKINTFMYDGEYITWTTDGANAGTVFIRNGKFNITNVCGLLDVKDESVNIKYLYYYLSLEAKKYVSAGMGNAKLMSNVVGKIMVHLPAMERQKEVATILDHFDTLCNDLTKGLSAEIEARQKQYEYYRDKLLAFKELDNCE